MGKKAAELSLDLPLHIMARVLAGKLDCPMRTLKCKACPLPAQEATPGKGPGSSPLAGSLLTRHVNVRASGVQVEDEAKR